MREPHLHLQVSFFMLFVLVYSLTVTFFPFFVLHCIQREEEQAREMAKAERMKQERELLAQKEEAARQARKKVKSLTVFNI